MQSKRFTWLQLEDFFSEDFVFTLYVRQNVVPNIGALQLMTNTHRGKEFKRKLSI